MNTLAVILLALVDGAVSWGPWPWQWHDGGYISTVTVVSTVTSTPTCFCPAETILTATGTTTGRCNCPLQTIAPTTITRCRSYNKTSNPRPTAAGTGTGTGVGPAIPSSTCSISQLPSYFFLRTSSTFYLSVNMTSKVATAAPYLSNATAFRVRNNSDGSITGISQLGLGSRSKDSSTSVEYRAWIQTSGVYGRPVEFFDVDHPPKSGYGIVTASFSTFLCRLSLITWMNHDLSYPLDCQGELWLGGGLSGGPCSSVNITVSTGIS